MILMMQNFASQPKINCKTITDVVMTSGFLYLLTEVFILADISIWRTA
jgi:hypothetical protein